MADQEQLTSAQIPGQAPEQTSWPTPEQSPGQIPGPTPGEPPGHDAVEPLAHAPGSVPGRDAVEHLAHAPGSVLGRDAVGPLAHAPGSVQGHDAEGPLALGQDAAGPSAHAPEQDAVEPLALVPGQDAVVPLALVPGQDTVDPLAHVPGQDTVEPLAHAPGQDAVGPLDHHDPGQSRVEVSGQVPAEAPAEAPAQAALLGALPSEAELIAALQRHSCWVCGASASSHEANLSHMMTHLVPVAAPSVDYQQDHQTGPAILNQPFQDLRDHEVPYNWYHRGHDSLEVQGQAPVAESMAEPGAQVLGGSPCLWSSPPASVEGRLVEAASPAECPPPAVCLPAAQHAPCVSLEPILEQGWQEAEMTHFKEPARFWYPARKVGVAGSRWRPAILSPPRRHAARLDTRGLEAITLRDENANLEAVMDEASLLFLEQVDGGLLINMKQKLRGLRQHGSQDPDEESGPAPANSTPLPEDYCMNVNASQPEQEDAAEDGDELFTCAICLKTFAGKANLLRHVEAEVRAMGNAARRGARKRKAAVLREGGPRFPCSHCGRVFGRSVDVCSHMRVHWAQGLAMRSAGHKTSAGSGDRRFACSYCPKKFRRRDHLNAHQQIHTGERPFACHLCNMTFRRKYHLQVHERKHDPALMAVVVAANDLLLQRVAGQRQQQTAVRPDQPASQAPKLAPTPAPKPAPKLAPTPAPKPASKPAPMPPPKPAPMPAPVQASAHSTSTFSCCGCPRIYNQRDKLKRHIRKAHVSAKAFVCKDCGVDCESRQQLASHSAVHDVTRLSCRCRTCGETLPDRKALAKHHKDLHDDRARTKAAHNTPSKKSSKASRKPSLKAPKIPRSSPKVSPSLTPKPASSESSLRVTRKSSSPKITSSLTAELRPVRNDKSLPATPFKKTSTAFTSKNANKVSPVSALVAKCRENMRFVCEKCGAVFIGEHTLRVHLESHSPNPELFRCYWCALKFSRRDMLWSHLLTHE